MLGFSLLPYGGSLQDIILSFVGLRICPLLFQLMQRASSDPDYVIQSFCLDIIPNRLGHL